MSKRIIVAMSGGVDSSVAAWLLREQGFEPVGVTFDLWPEHDETAAEDARAICRTLGIEHHLLDRREAFRAQVVEEFAREYLRGRTPNPCVRCNPRIKFAMLLETAAELDAHEVATGHYAVVGPPTEEEGAGLRQLIPGAEPAGRLLRRAGDISKDQSYVLHGLSRAQLTATRLPLGALRKAEVRRLAERAGLKTHDRPDSQEICFIRDDDYAGFLERLAPEQIRPGWIVDSAGNRLAEHRGVHHFTIGQRKGLGFAAGRPRFVVRIDPDTATVVVGDREETLSRRFLVRDVNWLAFDAPSAAFDALVKIRYRHTAAPARVEPRPDRSAFITFHTPQPAITPGQAAVIYHGVIVLGGGTIDAVFVS